MLYRVDVIHMLTVVGQRRVPVEKLELKKKRPKERILYCSSHGEVPSKFY